MSLRAQKIKVSKFYLKNTKNKIQRTPPEMATTEGIPTLEQIGKKT